MVGPVLCGGDNDAWALSLRMCASGVPGVVSPLLVVCFEDFDYRVGARSNCCLACRYNMLSSMH